MEYNKAFLVLSLALLLASTEAAVERWENGVFWIDFDCQGCCIENKNAQVIASIESTMDEIFVVDGIKFILSNGTTWIETYDKTTSFVKNESDSFVLGGVLPKSGAENYFEYYVCFRVKWPLRIDGTQEAVWFCGAKPLTQSIYEEGEIDFECCSDRDCPLVEACVEGECQAVICPCGQLMNHKCEKYECCQDSDCKTGKCINNNCKADEIIAPPTNGNGENGGEPVVKKDVASNLTFIIIASIVLLFVLLMYSFKRTKKTYAVLLNKGAGVEEKKEEGSFLDKLPVMEKEERKESLPGKDEQVSTGAAPIGDENVEKSPSPANMFEKNGRGAEDNKELILKDLEDELKSSKTETVQNVAQVKNKPVMIEKGKIEPEIEEPSTDIDTPMEEAEEVVEASTGGSENLENDEELRKLDEILEKMRSETKK
ncbi:MAG: hypothetical protein JXB14_02840 [Candidatus Altiarchaeota archaeon]|nr:hypothetical protein [Candidatus Altiarchaeota archaeon]